MRSETGWRLARPLLFLACLVPFLWMLALALLNRLGTDPAEAIAQETGIWTLRFLLITLSITPLRVMTGRNGLIRYRRMLGLYTLFYACVHFLCYLTFLATWDWLVIADDLTERPYIIAGFSALLLMIPLGITSTDAMQRRLKRNWKRLHRLVYVVGLLAITHFIWIAKANIGEQMLYLAILLFLYAHRIHTHQRRRARRSEAGGGVVR